MGKNRNRRSPFDSSSIGYTQQNSITIESPQEDYINRNELFPSWSMKEDYLKSSCELRDLKYGFCLLPEAYNVAASPGSTNIEITGNSDDRESLSVDNKKQSEAAEKQLPPSIPVFSVTALDGREIFSMKSKG